MEVLCQTVVNIFKLLAPACLWSQTHKGQLVLTQPWRRASEDGRMLWKGEQKRWTENSPVDRGEGEAWRGSGAPNLQLKSK